MNKVKHTVTHHGNGLETDSVETSDIESAGWDDYFKEEREKRKMGGGQP